MIDIKEYRKKYYRANLERFKEYGKKHRKKNNERRKQRILNRKLKFPERTETRGRPKITNPLILVLIKILKKRRAKIWRAQNREKRKIEKHERRLQEEGNGGTHTPDDWKLLKAKYSFTCLRCGRKEPEIILTEDHIVPISKGGTGFIENIQPLCQQCNSSKNNHTKDYRNRFPFSKENLERMRLILILKRIEGNKRKGQRKKKEKEVLCQYCRRKFKISEGIFQLNKKKLFFCSRIHRFKYFRRKVKIYNGFFVLWDTRSRCYKRRSRIILEEFLGRSLRANEMVFHLDGNRLNDEIENLQILNSKKEVAKFLSEKGLLKGNRRKGREYVKRGSDSPFWKREKFQCSACSKIFERISSYRNASGNNFCSRKCASEGTRILMKGIVGKRLRRKWIKKRKIKILAGVLKKILIKRLN